MRLIDADALVKELGSKWNVLDDQDFANKAVWRTIEAAPTVDVPDRKVGKWIPCKKKMPKPNEVVGDVAKYYLVQTEYGDMMVACYNAEGDARWWEQMYQYGAIMDEIVAWMELPEEYKEGGENEHTD